MSYKITINNPDLRSEAQRGLEAEAGMLRGRSGQYDVFGRFEGDQLVEVTSVVLCAVPIVKNECGALTNGEDLPNGWKAGTAIYFGCISMPPLA